MKIEMTTGHERFAQTAEIKLNWSQLDYDIMFGVNKGAVYVFKEFLLGRVQHWFNLRYLTI